MSSASPDSTEDPTAPAESNGGVAAKAEASPSLPRLSFGPHFEMHPVVFPAGAVIVLALVFSVFLFPSDELESVFEAIKAGIGDRFGWLYVTAMTGFLGLTCWLGLGRYGHVKLGTDADEPEFSRLSWFSMLFSAGMGIGLVFWSVAEPVYHYNTTPPGFADGLDSSRLAMAVTIFHWGFHPWALYAFVGLALAYFGFRRGLPLGFRSLLYPIFGDRVWGRLGDVVDTLTIVATLTGVATSLGIGAQQVNAGFAYLFEWPINPRIQVGLIAAITAVATVSVVLGLGTGIRRLSEINIFLAGSLMVLAIGGGGLVAFLGAVVENTGAYLQILPFSSFRTGSFSSDGRAWLNSWTVFYWAWWISWSPFVGMFIARVSRGRSIREFVTGVLLVPTAVGIAWLTAFGATTLRQHTDHLERVANEADYDPAAELPSYHVAMINQAGEPVQNAAGDIRSEDMPLTAVEYLDAPMIVNDTGEEQIAQLPTVLFALMEGLFASQALTLIAVGIATLCIILFFVTSSDSASMVIDMIASGGNPDPPVGTRLFWAITEGIVAASLLLAGGLQALQAAAITAALPLTIILLLACWGLLRSLATHETGR
ncbi:BCCT family transporter [Planctomycetaceae bacterium SH139]